MTLDQALPSYVAAHNPNHIILSGCVGRVSVTASGGGVEVSFNRYPNGGNLSIDMSSVLKKVYTKFAKSNYTDPFDYSGDVLYSLLSDYHFTSLVITLTDQQQPVANQVQFPVKVVNAALQIQGDVTELTEGMQLGQDGCITEVAVSTTGFSVIGSRDGTRSGVASTTFTFVAQEDLRLTLLRVFASIYGVAGTIPVTVTLDRLIGVPIQVHSQVFNVSSTLTEGSTAAIDFDISMEDELVQGDTYIISISVDGSSGHFMALDTDSTASPYASNFIQRDENDAVIANDVFIHQVEQTEFTDVTPEGVLNTWTGYPMSISLLESNGINRVLVNDGTQVIQPDGCQVKVIDSDCGGVYVKWLNELGGYDYWLFDPFESPALSTKDIGSINADLTDFGAATGREVNRGRESYPSKEVSSMIHRDYWPKMVGLLDSPEVYLYTGEQGSGDIDWIRVQLSTGNQKPFRPKSNFGQFKFNIELPQRYRQVV